LLIHDYLASEGNRRSLPLVDLQRQLDAVRPQVERNIHRVLHHGQFIMGPEVMELESQLAHFVGVRHAIACSSGTDALLMALMAYGIGPGDAVFTTPFTFVATAEVIALLRATPVFVDIDPYTLNIDPCCLDHTVQRVEAEGALRPRGIIPVDLFGLPADYDAIDAVAKPRKLFVLADAAQSFGALYKGRFAGRPGDAAATSFFPAKPLGCYGDGGAVLTDDDALAAAVRSIRIHGQGRNQYDNVRIGLNGREDTLQAAILLAKLQIFPNELEARQVIAGRYTAGLKDLVETVAVPEGYRSAWSQYSMMTDQRDPLRVALGNRGIPAAIYYPRPLHLQEAFAELGYVEGDLPVAESAARRILSLPMHPYLDQETQQYIVDTVRDELTY
jgi:UDP-2-acetamido-2-deoxy-ribo-hexuluronate aminotransferase